MGGQPREARQPKRHSDKSKEKGSADSHNMRAKATKVEQHLVFFYCCSILWLSADMTFFPLILEIKPHSHIYTIL